MSASLVRSRAMVTHLIDRHRWDEITDGAVLQEDATIVEIGIYEHRSPLAPGGYPFVGVSGPQYRRFIEGAANDLRRERQTLRREAYALGERRAASDIEWRH